MADWPASGVTDWNTKMLANLAVGHDTDGTHTKSQMLTDMGWSPTSYAGDESITFPNGLIMKHGFKSGIGSQTITFGVAFPTAITSHQVTLLENNDSDRTPVKVKTASASALVIYSSNGGTGSSWQAWGY